MEELPVRSTLATVFCLGLAATAGAQDYQWRPAPIQTAAAVSPTPAVTLGRPVILGNPTACPPGRDIITASYRESVLGPPQATVRAQAPEISGPTLVPPPGSPPPPPPPPPPNEPYNCGVVTTPPAAGGHPFYEKLHGLFRRPTVEAGPGTTRKSFQSDHGFDDVGLTSPVSNPFLFEDPRSLTELRPIFMWQQTPSNTANFRGGDIEYAGVQARLAVTERLSVVMSKLGFVWVETHNPAEAPNLQNSSGFAELWAGPKYTFYRCEQTGTVAAGGLNFQIPIGSRRVAQDTGDLTLEPYVSFGQNFGRSQFGSFNFLNTTGYAVDVGDRRSDYLFSSFHLDYDVARLHKIYPLVEFNYFFYTDSGDRQPLNFEGRDLLNLGSSAVQGHSDLTMAAGLRYKFCEAIQAGLVGEFPLLGQHDLQDFRLTADMIFRY